MRATCGLFSASASIAPQASPVDMRKRAEKERNAVSKLAWRDSPSPSWS